MLRIGEYKTAPERLTKKESTEKNKEQINRLLDNIYSQFVSSIAEGRNISNDSLIKIIDNGPYTSAEAFKFNLVDGLFYFDELDEKINSEYSDISLSQYIRDTLANESWKRVPEIAIIVADGEIRFSGSGSDNITPAPLKKTFKQISNNKNIDAILFRVNSPGGFALAADDIFHSASTASSKKPMAVSMGNVGASGGFQIALPAKQIFANKTTITGSIGIFGGKVDLSKMYEKLEIGKELYTRGKYAGLMTSIKPFSEDEREKYFSQLLEFYNYFVKLVSESRNLTEDSVNALAQGKVWTGSEAVNNGLIDSDSGLMGALEYLADSLGTSNYRIKIYPKKKSFFGFTSRLFPFNISSLFSKSGLNQKEIENRLTLLEFNGFILNRMLFDITIH